jgi:uncharacterized protein (TIGR03086 family)
VSGFIKTEHAARPTFSGMTTASTQYEAAARPLSAVLDAVPQDRWSALSPCEGWTARDVLRHLIETQRDYLAGHGVDLGPAPDLDSDPAAAWRDHAKRVQEVMSDDGLAEREYDGHFGRTTVGANLVRFYGFDMLVHRWDVAQAAGVDAGLTADELDRIEGGADGFGDALYLDGVCRPGVEAPADADQEARVLARLGRTARA